MLAQRVLAGFIDLGVLLVVFVVTGLLLGGLHHQTVTSAVNPGIHQTDYGVYLNNGQFLIFVVLCLAYYFVLEALTNQTIGKRAMKIRVVSLDGGTPSTKAILLRTLGRIIDILPLLYFVGMVVLLIGKPRRRIGDRLARTTVAPSRNSPTSEL